MAYKKKIDEELEDVDDILDENLQHENEKYNRKKGRELEKAKKIAKDERLYGGTKKNDWR